MLEAAAAVETTTVAGDLFRLAMAFLLVLANGFFVGTEFALVSARRARITNLAESGNKRAKTVLRVMDSLSKVISGTQLGITIASLALGWIAEDAVAHLIERPIAAFIPEYAASATTHTVAIAIAFTVVTYMHILLGELVPKTAALEKAEAVALFVARPIELFYTVFKIPIWLLNKSGNFVGRLLGLKMQAEHVAAHTEEELRYMVEMSHRGGHLNAGERELINNVFEFADLAVRDCMVPRTEVVTLGAESTVEHAAEIFESTRFSRIPVTEMGLDSITGALHSKDVLTAARRNPHQIARELVRPVLFVPPSAQLDHVLARMQRTGNHLAIVVDEHGGLEGIVTLEDIIEEIVGEIRDEFDEGEDEPVVAQPDGSFLINAAIPIRTLNRRLDLKVPESTHYATVAGFLLAEAGAIPKQGQEIPFGTGRFVVDNVRRNRVITVRFLPGAAPPVDEEQAVE